MKRFVEDSSIINYGTADEGFRELRYTINDLSEARSITFYLNEDGYGEIQTEDPVAHFIGEKERKFQYSEEAAERILDADEEVWREFAEREFINLLRL